MAASLSPFFRSPWTNITAGLMDYQLLGRCNLEEMDVFECLERHGLDRGIKKCKHLIDDFRECARLIKQFKRFVAIRDERERQIATGQVKCDKMYVTPRIDSY